MSKFFAWFFHINKAFVYSARYDMEPTWKPSPSLLSQSLDPSSIAHEDPSAGRNIIARSKNCLEIADWGYCHTGTISFVSLLLFVVSLVSYVACNFAAARSPLITAGWQAFTLVALSPSLLMTLWGARPLLLQLTAYTHYPVRLDRKNQLVHVFINGRPDGTRSIPWKELTFGIGAGSRQVGVVNRAICGYRERADGTFDWFHLGVAHVEPDYVLRQWEYFRRFMEDGPEQLPDPPILLGIDQKRESFATGAKNCWLTPGADTSVNVVGAMWTAPGSMVRWLIMRIGRRPTWPDHILALTPVADDDPYANVPEPRKDVHVAIVWMVTLGALAFDALWGWMTLHFLRP